LPSRLEATPPTQRGQPATHDSHLLVTAHIEPPGLQKRARQPRESQATSQSQAFACRPACLWLAEPTGNAFITSNTNESLRVRMSPLETELKKVTT
jgi:hypothetical protein